jgi:signal transduction histidine kinase
MASVNKQLLAESQLFEELTDAELDKIVGLCREKVFKAETVIFSEGEPASRLYIVEDGRVVLEMSLRIGSKSGRHGVIDVITKGQAFGWWGGEAYPLTMSARCVEKTKVIVIDAAGLWRLLEKEHSIGYKVMKRLVGVVSSRLRSSRDTLAHVLSIASHDLKAPLAAVESYHQVMLNGYAGEVTDKQKDMLVRSSERIKGLLNLIDNILDISRIEARELKMEEMSLLKVVSSTTDVIERLAAEKGVHLEVFVPEDLPMITGAPNRLEQVFTNLLGNAVKFTPEGGAVTLRVSEEDKDIMVEVMDTGVGIDPDDLPKIFTDFYRGIRVDSAGAGLGLPVSKRIIEAHGGEIRAESPCPETGIGSKFTFTLPKNLAGARGEKRRSVKL